ncbi:MAG: carotenoid biosynthesis protein [Chloroflexota bacterium]
MRLTRLFFILHLAALAFGVGGLVIALPHPELWSRSPTGAAVFQFGMQRTGALYIVLGAATMLTFGLAMLGPRRTLLFFVLATVLPLGAELLGTGTGWPFGAYSYTDGLGLKIAGRVPFTVPLSWFYMGFSSYLLALRVVARWSGKPRPWQAVLLGAWLLTAWDLVLDPAMASPALPVRFWIWHQSGPYFGMPLTNLAGWSATGLIFIGLSRLLWRTETPVNTLSAWLPFGVYAANIVFAMALSLSVRLWPAALAALLLGIVPASSALGSSSSPLRGPWSRRLRNSKPLVAP